MLLPGHPYNGFFHFIPFTLIIISNYCPAKGISTVDPCTSLATSLTHHPTTSWSIANACLTSFPISARQARETLHSLNKTLDMYFFQEWAAHPPSSLPGQYPIQVKEILDPVENRLSSFPNQLSFQRALMNAFTQLNDGHLAYSPNCFQQLSYSQPFSIMAHHTRTRNGSIIGPIVLYVHAISRMAPSENQVYQGAEIIRIHGEAALDHLQRWADKSIGKFKDPMTRLQKTLSSVRFNGTDWFTIPGDYTHRSFLPSSPIISWTLRLRNGSVVEVEMPWMVHSIGSPGALLPFSSSSTYWKAYCEPDNFPLTSRGGLSDDEGDGSLKKRSGGPRDTSHSSYNRRSLPAPSGDPAMGIPSPIIASPSIALYLLDVTGTPLTPLNAKTTHEPLIAVLVLPTLAFFDGEADQWRMDVSRILGSMGQYSIKHLLIDVQGNAGGNGCLATEFISTLFPDSNLPFPETSTPIPKRSLITPLFSLITLEATRGNVRQSSFHPSHYLSATTLLPLNETQILHSDHRTQAPYPHTQGMVDTCPTMVNNPLASLHLSLPSPENMAIISDGACSSACGRLTHHLRKVHHVPGVVVGLISPRAFDRQISGYPASQVYTLDDLLTDQELTQSSSYPSSPGFLPIQADFRFTLRGSFPAHKDKEDVKGRKLRELPLEYQWDPAEKVIPWTENTVNRPDHMWTHVVQQLSWSIHAAV